MMSLRVRLFGLTLLSLAGCGREPEKPFEPWRATLPPREAPQKQSGFEIVFPQPVPPPALSSDDLGLPPLEAPRPEAGLAHAAALTVEEAELVGTYKLREFIAMSGQVPGPDARLNGTLELEAGRRVTLSIVRHGLLKPPHPPQVYAGGGRWHLSGNDLRFEPFAVDTGARARKPPPGPNAFAPPSHDPPETGPAAVAERDVQQVGPWVARWKVVREDGKILLQAGEFTYERVPPK